MPTGTPLRQDVKQAYSWIEHRYNTYKNSDDTGKQEVREQLLVKYDDIENVLTESKEYLKFTNTVDPLFSKLVDKLASLWRKTKLEINLYQIGDQSLDYGQLLQLRLQRDDISDSVSISSRTTNTSRFEDEKAENSGRCRQYVPHLSPLYRAVIRAKIKKIKRSKVKELEPTFKQKPTNLHFNKTTQTDKRTSTQTITLITDTIDRPKKQRDIELSSSDSESELEQFPWVNVSDDDLDLPDYQAVKSPANVENDTNQPSEREISRIEQSSTEQEEFISHHIREQKQAIEANTAAHVQHKVIGGDRTVQMDEEEEFNEHYPDDISNKHSSIKPTLHIPSHLETIGESEDEENVTPPTDKRLDYPKRRCLARPHVIPSVIITNDDGLETIPEVLTCHIEGTFNYNQSNQPGITDSTNQLLSTEFKQIEHLTSTENQLHDELAQSLNEKVKKTEFNDKLLDMQQGNGHILQRLTADETTKEQSQLSFMQNGVESSRMNNGVSKKHETPSCKLQTAPNDNRVVHTASIISHTQMAPLYEFLNDDSQIHTFENLAYQSNLLSVIPAIETANPTISKHSIKVRSYTADINTPTFCTKLLDQYHNSEAKPLSADIPKLKQGGDQRHEPPTMYMSDRNTDGLASTEFSKTQNGISSHNSPTDPSLDNAITKLDYTKIMKSSAMNQRQANTEIVNPELTSTSHSSVADQIQHEEIQTNLSCQFGGANQSTNGQIKHHACRSSLSPQQLVLDENSAYLHTLRDYTVLCSVGDLNSVDVRKPSLSITPNRQLEAVEVNDFATERGVRVEQYVEEDSVHELNFSDLTAYSQDLLKSSNLKSEESHHQLDTSIADSGLGSFLPSPQSINEEIITPHKQVNRQKAFNRHQAFMSKKSDEVSYDDVDSSSSPLVADPELDSGLASFESSTLLLETTKPVTDLSKNSLTHTSGAIEHLCTKSQLLFDDGLNGTESSAHEHIYYAHTQVKHCGQTKSLSDNEAPTSIEADQEQKQLSIQPDLLDFEHSSRISSEKRQLKVGENNSQTVHKVSDAWDVGPTTGQDVFNRDQPDSISTRRPRLKKSYSSASDLEAIPYSITRRKKIHAKTIETQTVDDGSEDLVKTDPTLKVVEPQDTNSKVVEPQDTTLRRNRNWWIFLVPFSVIVIALTVLLYFSTNCNDRTTSCHWWFYHKKITRIPPH